MPADPLGAATHSHVDSGRALNIFAAETAGFDAAFATVRERREAWLTIAGHRVHLRIAGGAIADPVLSAFAHVTTAPHGTDAPALGIDMWDESEARVPWPLVDAWDRIRSEDGRLFQDVSPFVSGWLDRDGHRLVARVTRASRFGPGDALYQPFSNLLALWLADRAAPAVHAGAVGRHGRAVMVAGRSGAGKSTVSLSCLLAGFDFLGDDFVVLAPGDAAAFSVHGVYSTAHLDGEHLKRFPGLGAVAKRAPGEGKAVIRLDRAFPTRLSRVAAVQAIVLPRFVPGSRTRLHGASKSVALMAMAGSSLFARPAATPAAFHALAALADAVPAYWLEMGSDVSEIPGSLESLLRA
jgi:hypothetical protein